MNKRILSALTAVACAVGLSACGTTAEEPMDTTVVVQTSVVEEGSTVMEGAYVGQISAADSAAVVPMVSGDVEEVAVMVGQTVNAGDLLCQFDDTTSKLSLASAQASYNSAAASAQAQLGGSWNLSSYQAQAGIESTQASIDDLYEQLDDAKDAKDDAREARNQARDALEQLQQQTGQQTAESAQSEELQKATEAYQSAQAAYDSAQSAVDTLETNIESTERQLSTAQGTQSITNTQVYADTVNSLSKSVDAARTSVDSAVYQVSMYRITAPISGVVEQVNIKENNYFGAGQTAVVISGTQDRMLTFDVAQNVQQNMAYGQTVSVEKDGKTYFGKVTEIGVAANSTGLYTVKAVLENAADAFDNGSYVELRTAVNTIDNCILVPLDAVHFDDGNAYIYLVQDGTAVETPVEVNTNSGDYAVVTGGLSSGQEIVATWSASLKNGARVRNADEPQTEEDTADSAAQ